MESDSFGSTYDENAATTLNRVEYTSGTHEVTGNIQTSGEWGAIHIKGGTTTVSATTVYAVETGRYAIMVPLSSTAANLPSRSPAIPISMT